MSTGFVKQAALKYFDDVGIALAVRPSTMDNYLLWLTQGHHGEMEYLRRHAEQKANPQKLLPSAKSWIVATLHYDTKEPLYSELKEELKSKKSGWIARYARGQDYHLLISERQKKLIAELEKEFPNEKFLGCVDAQPVLERDIANNAGLGWVGKNTCLIDQHKGSFFFISEILTTLELEPDKPVADHCGTCDKCIVACPTEALTPHRLDATKCISYWTIESKTKAPDSLSARFEQNVFGCDICQDVCPWNKKSRRTVERPDPRGSGVIPLKDWLSLGDVELKAKTKDSALSRAKAQHFRENLEIALRNSEDL